MEWRVKIHRKALKFLENLEDDKRTRLIEKINELIHTLDKEPILLQSHYFDIKKLRGKWRGFFRLRVGDIKIVFRVDVDNRELFIYHIHYREKVYK